MVAGRPLHSTVFLPKTTLLSPPRNPLIILIWPPNSMISDYVVPMRSFQWGATVDPVPGGIVMLLSRIDRAAGSESQYADQLPELLAGLAETARVESITASSAIEGVVVDAGRTPTLVSSEHPRVRNRSEAEFAGYRRALDYLYSADAGPFSVGLVLHLHRLLFSLTNAGGGRLKLDDNVVVEADPAGGRRIRFTPVSSVETPNYLAELVDRTNEALRAGEVHPLITIGACTLDLLCIHPFADGNGRVARLITSHLLSQSGYHVGRYVSLEQLIFDTKIDYYRTLGESTTGWFDDGHHSVWPWVDYLLQRLELAYGRFESRVASGLGGGSKQDRVRDFVLLQGPPAFRMADIRRAVPGVSDQTIRLVLTALKAEGLIDHDGAGRTATWYRH
jgi:Fic family protein